MLARFSARLRRRHERRDAAAAAAAADADVRRIRLGDFLPADTRKDLPGGGPYVNRLNLDVRCGAGVEGGTESHSARTTATRQLHERRRRRARRRLDGSASASSRPVRT